MTYKLGPLPPLIDRAPNWVADLAEEFVTSRLARGEIAPITAKGHRSHLRLLGQLAQRSGALDAEVVDEYVRATSHLAASTRRLRYSTVGAFLAWAFEVDQMAANLSGLLPSTRRTPSG